MQSASVPFPVQSCRFLHFGSPSRSAETSPALDHDQKSPCLLKMGRPKRDLLATAQETSTPPATLSDDQSIARVLKVEGNNLYSVDLPSGKSILVELPSRFRSTIWIKRGGFVLVDTRAFDGRDNKLDGEIVNVVRDEKQWRKEIYWYVLCHQVCPGQTL